MNAVGTPMRILVADDDPTVGLLMQAALELHGYEVTIVEDGISAVTEFRNRPTAVVLLDADMPGLTGFQVCKEIRGIDSDVPIILVTGYDDMQSIDQAYECGATDFIAKPINWTLIGYRLRYILRAFHDAAKRREAESKVNRLLNYDTLTGLPNREAFVENLTLELSRNTQDIHSGEQLAVLLLDIDGFNCVNDSLGHAMGDLLLQWTSVRLGTGLPPHIFFRRQKQAFIPGAQAISLARLAGDEFTLLLPYISEPEEALLVANKIRELIARPFAVEGQDLVVTASIGIAIYPDDALEASTLLMHAETAMYAAKDSGRNNCQFYSTALTQRAIARLALGTDLHLALERDEFFLEYQPQVEASSGCITAIEALIRWRHPDKGLISPGEFIPLAEELGLILPIGGWVIKTACTDAMRWQARGLKPVRIAVNISTIQFGNDRILDEIRVILAETGLSPDRLELEITESVLMVDAKRALALMHAFRADGIHIALDDFGTGYSSLQYLKQLPLSKLKIDRAFVRDMPGSKADEAIVRAVVSVAHALDISVTAEGVETEAQYLSLTQLGCNNIQGHFVFKPVVFEKIADLLCQPT